MEIISQKIKVIVTGGAGFIGSHLVERLVADGYDVHVIDNLISGKREHVHQDATFYKIDICDKEALTMIFQNVDTVFHLAALPSVQYSVEYPSESAQVNTLGTINVFDVARRAGARRIVFSSSSAVYGDQNSLPIHEAMIPHPASPYGLQKLEGELYARLFHELYGIEIVCLRYFNVFGPRQNPAGAYASVIPKFIAQKERGESLSIVGDGTQTRDFVHVRDIVDANISASKSDKVGAGEYINIGSGTRYSVLEIAGFVSGPVVHIAPRVEMKDTLADITLAKKLLNWYPQVDFQNGIKELLQK